MTSAHISDNLPRLLTGDAARDEVLAAAEHLRGCPDCQQELVSAVVAHASLTSAHRFAPDVVAARSPAATQDPVTPDPLPDLSAMFAQVHEEATRPTSGPAYRALRGRRWLVAAAAAVIVAGGGVTIAETVGGGSSHSVAQSVQLGPVGDIRASATATISGGKLRIDAGALPKLDASRQYEVWLADSTGVKLRPVGYIGADRTAELPVPPAVMSKYSSIAISIQKTDQVAFSGDMVVRGHYA